MPTLDELMASMQGVSDEERKAALFQALTTTGLGLLAAPGGNIGQNIGRAGLLGVGDYRNSLAGVQQGKRDQIKLRGEAMDALSKEQGYNDEAAARDVAMNFKMPGPAIPAGGPTNGNAAILANAPKPGRYEEYMALGDAYKAKGLMKKAQEAYDYAAKQRPKIDTKPQIGTDAQGNRYMFVLDDQGNEKRLNANPDVDPLHWVNNGKSTFGVDPRTGNKRSNDIAMQLSPADEQRIGIDRARLSLEQSNSARAAAGEGKPTWDAGSGQFVYAPTASNPGGAAVVPSGYKADTKAQAQKAERASTVLEIIKQAEDIIPNATGSYAGAGYDKAAQFFGASPDGADATAKLQALEGALMMQQPRMEGPQSDRDTQLYKQMAAKIGDPTVPRGQKLAALDAIKKLYGKYPNSGTIRFDAQGEPVK